MHGFLRYAAEHWTIHFQWSEVHEQDDLKIAAKCLYYTNWGTVGPWFEIWRRESFSHLYSLIDDEFRRVVKDRHVLQIISYFGHHAIMVNTGLYGETQEEITKSLYWASGHGLARIVALLMENKADVTTQGGRYGSALQLTSYQGHEQVVKLLLDKIADVDAKGGKYGNALQAATYAGDERVMQLLLDKAVNVNAQGGEYKNAL